MDKIRINNKKLLKGLAIVCTTASYLASCCIVYMTTVVIAYKAADAVEEVIDKFIGSKVKKEDTSLSDLMNDSIEINKEDTGPDTPIAQVSTGATDPTISMYRGFAIKDFGDGSFEVSDLTGKPIMGGVASIDAVHESIDDLCAAHEDEDASDPEDIPAVKWNEGL